VPPERANLAIKGRSANQLALPQCRVVGLYSGAYRGGECWAFVIECRRFNSMPADEPRAAKLCDQESYSGRIIARRLLSRGSRPPGAGRSLLEPHSIFQGLDQTVKDLCDRSAACPDASRTAKRTNVASVPHAEPSPTQREREGMAISK
jgi:hypothetical protein